MPYHMVVTTLGSEDLLVGLVPVGPGRDVIEIGLASRHPTARKDTSRITSFNCPAKTGGRAPSGDSLPHNLPGLRIGDGESPLTFLLFPGDLSGNVGNDGPESAQLARLFA
jgi:hypothetical protein